MSKFSAYIIKHGGSILSYNKIASEWDWRLICFFSLLSPNINCSSFYRKTGEFQFINLYYCKKVMDMREKKEKNYYLLEIKFRN